jgi:hypothetical protein
MPGFAPGIRVLDAASSQDVDAAGKVPVLTRAVVAE